MSRHIFHKLLLVALALSSLPIAIAKPTMPSALNTPFWEISFGTAYWQTLDTMPYASNANATQTHQFSKERRLGFQLEGFYQWDDVNAVQLGWISLHRDTNQVLDTGEYSFRLLSTFADDRGFPTVNQYTRIESVYDERLNTVYVEFARELPSIAPHHTARIRAGLQYTQFSTLLIAQGFDDVLGTEPANVQTRTHFYGIGPRVGLDANITLVPQLQLLVSGTTGVLYGAQQWQQIALEPAQILPYTDEVTNKQWHPFFAGQLGVQYDIHLPNQHVVKLAAGYEATHILALMRDPLNRAKPYTYHGPFAKIVYRPSVTVRKRSELYVNDDASWEVSARANYVMLLAPYDLTTDSTLSNITMAPMFPTWGGVLASKYQYDDRFALQLAWQHFGGVSKSKQTSDGPNLHIPSMNVPDHGDSIGDFHQVDSQVDYRFNNVYSNVLAHFTPHEALTTQLGLGIQYLNFYHLLNVDGFGEGINDLGKVITTNRLHAIGPRFGFGFDLKITPSVSVVADSFVSLLYSTVEWDQSVDSPGNGSVTRNVDSFSKAIPAFGGRLGLNYQYRFNETKALTLEGGYDAAKYESLFYGPLKHSRNVAYHGPYMKLILEL